MTINKHLAVLLMATVGAIGLSAVAKADTSDKKIAFSNNFAGNSWRQSMLKSYQDVSSKAVSDKIVGAADIFTTTENQVTEQAAQIQNLILQGYNAIVINAASPDALNGAIKEACDAGIVVVSFDGTVTEPCAYRVVIDFKGISARQLDFLAKKYPKGGNILEIRGLAGTSIDDAMHAGILQGVAKNPQFKIVGSVEGDWNTATAQKAVAQILPSLPDLVAVVDQGGDGYGAAQAIKAAGRPTPTIILGNRQDELAWWKEQRAAGDYDTLSATIAPGISTLAFWVAQQILDGKTVPHDLTVPYLEVTADTLDKTLADTPVGSVASAEYTQDDAIKAIAANTK